MKDITEDLSNIAELLAIQALGETVSLENRIEIFKILTNYQFHKNNPKKAKENDDGDTFQNFRERVAATAGGNGENHPYGE